MSYYENRIKALEEKVAEMARNQRMKAIPVEAKLIEQIARLQAENKRLRKAGDAMANWFRPVAGVESLPAHIVYDAWLAAKEGKQP